MNKEFDFKKSLIFYDSDSEFMTPTLRLNLCSNLSEQLMAVKIVKLIFGFYFWTLADLKFVSLTCKLVSPLLGLHFFSLQPKFNFVRSSQMLSNFVRNSQIS